VLAAIAADPELTLAQKQSLSQIYETFRRENARTGTGRAPDPDPEAGAGPKAGPEPAAEPDRPPHPGQNQS
jgi:hypothetical protein